MNDSWAIGENLGQQVTDFYLVKIFLNTSCKPILQFIILSFIFVSHCLYCLWSEKSTITASASTRHRPIAHFAFFAKIFVFSVLRSFFIGYLGCKSSAIKVSKWTKYHQDPKTYSKNEYCVTGPRRVLSKDSSLVNWDSILLIWYSPNSTIF